MTDRRPVEDRRTTDNLNTAVVGAPAAAVGATRTLLTGGIVAGPLDIRGWGAFSTMTGALFLATWILLFAPQGARAANVAFAVAIALALAWTSLLAARRLTRPGEE
jgi:hypothetical protein